MTCKAFMPPLNSQWETLEDWEFPVGNKSWNNDDFLAGAGLDLRLRSWPEYKEKTRHERPGQGWSPYVYPNWTTDFHRWVEDEKNQHGPLIFPRGTVIQFNRYHASNSGAVQMTLEIIKSPELSLTPKKAGGKFKGKARFYLDLNAFNNLPLLEEYHA